MSERKIYGRPKGIQRFEGIPCRRFLNKSKFYLEFIRSVKTGNPFCLN